MSSYIPKLWVDRQAQYLDRVTLKNVDDVTDVKTYMVDYTSAEGTVTVQGDVFDAATMNALEGRINDAFDAVEGVTLTGTLAVGSTSVTLSNVAITTTSMIDVYTDVYGVNPTAISVVTGSITLTFDAQESAIGVKVVVR